MRKIDGYIPQNAKTNKFGGYVYSRMSKDYVPQFVSEESLRIAKFKYSHRFRFSTPGIAIRTCIIVFCGLVVINFFSTGITARLKTENSDADFGKVSAFDIDMVSPGDEMVTAGDTGETSGQATYPFTITSRSEVAVEYQIEVTLESPLPQGLTISMDSRKNSGTKVSDTVYTFPGGSFPAGGGKAEHTLIFSVDYNTLENDYYPKVTLNVFAEQID